MVTFDEIERARERLADHLPPTPLLRAWDLERAAGTPLWLKAELFQRTGSFKPRGSLNWILSASTEERKRGLITFSAGNHAMALAWAAREAGMELTVLMPEGSSPMKVEATRAYGADVTLLGDIHEAIAKMQELREERDLLLVHPYDNLRVIAGQGTVGLEIVEQLPEVDLILCPVGGGGLVSGVAIAVRSRQPAVKVIGVEPEGAPTLQYAWDQGGPASLPKVETIAKSLGAAVAGEHTYALSREWVDGLVTVSDEEICAALRAMLWRGHLYAEPGGVVGLAALLAGRVPLAGRERPVAIVTGGNLDLADLPELL